MDKKTDRKEDYPKKDEKSSLDDKVTKMLVFICDQGHYGSTKCGNCYSELDDKAGPYKRCPVCDYRFEGADIDYNRGGSDF